MALYPLSPLPRQTNGIPYNDPTYRSQFDGGAISTRARFLRRRMTGMLLTYTINHDELMTLQDFWTQHRGPALPFEFRLPSQWAHTVVTGTAGTPYTITTQGQHGFQTGEQVYIENVDPVANGIQTVTRQTPTTVTLDSTSGGGSATSGTIIRYWPKARFLSEEWGPFVPIMGFGPPRDTEGLHTVVIGIEESW